MGGCWCMAALGDATFKGEVIDIFMCGFCAHVYVCKYVCVSKCSVLSL